MNNYNHHLAGVIFLPLQARLLSKLSRLVNPTEIIGSESNAT